MAEVANPAGGSGTALRFTALNSDVYPLTPTANPRAQLITPLKIVTANKPFWESYEVYVPASFPLAQTYVGWLSLGSPFYGAPWNGSPSVELQMTHGEFRWMTNGYAQQPWKLLWRTPIVPGSWIRFTWYVVPSTSGFAELYVHGQPVSVAYNGQTQNGADLPVLDASNAAGLWYSQLSVYYKLDTYQSATLYFRDFAIGTNQQAAESMSQ